MAAPRYRKKPQVFFSCFLDREEAEALKAILPQLRLIDFHNETTDYVQSFVARAGLENLFKALSAAEEVPQ